MRRMLSLILAAMLMLSHGSMSAAVPHVHAAIAGDQHHADSTAHHGDHAGMAADEDGADQPDGGADNDVDVTAHVHLVAGLNRAASNNDWPTRMDAEPPLPAVMRQLVSREVPPLLEPPTA